MIFHSYAATALLRMESPNSASRCRIWRKSLPNLSVPVRENMPLWFLKDFERIRKMRRIFGYLWIELRYSLSNHSLLTHNAKHVVNLVKE